MLRTLIELPVHTDLELVRLGSWRLKYWELCSQKGIGENNGWAYVMRHESEESEIEIFVYASLHPLCM
jgi:hypothetical protein